MRDDTVPTVTLTPNEVDALHHAQQSLVARSVTTRLDVSRNADILSHKDATSMLRQADLDESFSRVLLDVLRRVVPDLDEALAQFEAEDVLVKG